MTTIVATLLLIVIAVGCAFRGWGYWAWVIPGACGLGWWSASLTWPVFGTLAVVLVALALVFGLPTVRRAVVSRFVMRRIGPLLPVLGDTERIALEAGTVWWDLDLFSGAPDWRRLLQFVPQPLSAGEQAFLDGPVEELCAMLDQPTILRLGDLPPNVWEFLKRRRFFGLIIPESFGGLGFSAAAHSAVVSKIGSRSTTAAVTVMVPNSRARPSCSCTTGLMSRRPAICPVWRPGRRSHASRSPDPRPAATRRRPGARVSCPAAGSTVRMCSGSG